MLCPTPFFLNRKIKMKIKAKNQNVASMELIVPVDGRISIDANGVAEVSAKCAAALVKGTNDWDYAKKATAFRTMRKKMTTTRVVNLPTVSDLKLILTR